MAVRAHHSSTETENILKEFWRIEEAPNRPNLTEVEKQCESLFALNHKRDKHGRYIVPLPYSSRLPELGATRDMAEQRLKQLERRFDKNRDEYVKFMREYLELGHRASSTKRMWRESGHHQLSPTPLCPQSRQFYNEAARSL